MAATPSSARLQAGTRNRTRDLRIMVRPSLWNVELSPDAIGGSGHPDRNVREGYASEHCAIEGFFHPPFGEVRGSSTWDCLSNTLAGNRSVPRTTRLGCPSASFRDGHVH